MLLEREDKLRREMEAKMQEQKIELERTLTPKPVISEEQVSALQARIEAMVATELLTGDECDAVIDLIADHAELTATTGVVTQETLRREFSGSAQVVKLQKIIAVSLAVRADASFARQLRRRLTASQ